MMTPTSNACWIIATVPQKGILSPMGAINTNSNPTGLPSGLNEMEPESDKTQYLTISHRSYGFSHPKR